MKRTGPTSRERYGPHWERTRRLILDRDARVCWVCGGDGADSVDHVVRIHDGGTHEPDNLRAAHLSCNIKRSSRMKRSRRQRKWGLLPLPNPSRWA